MINLIAIPAFVVAPAGILFYYFWIRDRWEKEPWSVIWILFGVGCLSVIPAAIIETIVLGADLSAETIGQTFVMVFFGVALVEEVVKFIFIYLFTYKSKYFREEYDGIIYAVAVGLGFAFLENIFYVVLALMQGSTGLMTAVLRSITAVPLHALVGVVMGYYLGLSRFKDDPGERLKTNAKGVFYAILFHGIYDFFVFLLMVIPENVQGWCWVGFIWTLIVLWGTAHRLARKAQEKSAARWSVVDEVPVAGSRFCRVCGGNVGQDARFCKHCGGKLGV